MLWNTCVAIWVKTKRFYCQVKILGNGSCSWGHKIVPQLINKYNTVTKQVDTCYIHPYLLFDGDKFYVLDKYLPAALLV